jgi:hypothetical protein
VAIFERQPLTRPKLPGRCVWKVCRGPTNLPRVITAIMLDDATFCEQIAELLKHYCGHTTEEIGDVDPIRA